MHKCQLIDSCLLLPLAAKLSQSSRVGLKCWWLLSMEHPFLTFPAQGLHGWAVDTGRLAQLLCDGWQRCSAGLLCWATEELSWGMEHIGPQGLQHFTLALRCRAGAK